MDFIKHKSRISEAIQKYKYVCIVLLAGVVLMMLPDRKGQTIDTKMTEPVAVAESISVETKLAEILSNVKGAGQVEVMLTVAQGERTIYQTDSSYSQSENNADSRTQTILITDSQRNETGLVHQTNPPVYQGAIVLTQGANDPTVKLSIVEAVSDVTGLGADKISVLIKQ